jgi:beta-barrel assembly-enhancing protease
MGRSKACRFFILIQFLVLAAALSGCATVYNAATGRQETLLMDTQSEVALGRDMDAQLQKQFKVITGGSTASRMEGIGKRVAAASDRQDIEYIFRAVEDKELNAFAIPGGYIYVHSGLMEKATDDELACVIAHEIGHVAAKHSVKKMQAVLGYDILTGILLGATGQKTVADLINIFVFNPVTLAYSRQDELFADKLAIRYAKRAGFNPYGMVTFFGKLKKEQQERGPGLRIEILSSHPDMDKRIEKAKEEIAAISP